MPDIPSLVMIFLLGGAMVATLIGLLMAGFGLVRTVVTRRARFERQLSGDWWPGFERQFREYVRELPSRRDGP